MYDADISSSDTVISQTSSSSVFRMYSGTISGTKYGVNQTGGMSNNPGVVEYIYGGKVWGGTAGIRHYHTIGATWGGTIHIGDPNDNVISSSNPVVSSDNYAICDSGSSCLVKFNNGILGGNKDVYDPSSIPRFMIRDGYGVDSVKRSGYRFYGPSYTLQILSSSKYNYKVGDNYYDEMQFAIEKARETQLEISVMKSCTNTIPVIMSAAHRPAISIAFGNSTVTMSKGITSASGLLNITGDGGGLTVTQSHAIQFSNGVVNLSGNTRISGTGSGLVSGIDILEGRNSEYDWRNCCWSRKRNTVLGETVLLH